MADKGSITFYHKLEHREKVKGENIKKEESIVYGTKGLSIKSYTQKGAETEKIMVKSDNDIKQFTIIHIKNKGEPKRTEGLDLAKLITAVSKISKLKFAEDFLKKLKTQKGGRKAYLMRLGVKKRKPRKSKSAGKKGRKSRKSKTAKKKRRKSRRSKSAGKNKRKSRSKSRGKNKKKAKRKSSSRRRRK